MYPGTAEFVERALEIGRWIYVWAQSPHRLKNGQAAERGRNVLRG